MYQIKLNNRFLFHSPNINLLNNIKKRYQGSVITFFRKSVSSIAPPVQNVVYTEFDRYIIDGVRQQDIGTTIRSNVSLDSRIVVNGTVEFKYMTFLRIPPVNWTVSGMQLRPTLSVVSGSGGTIDGGTAQKQFYAFKEVTLNPESDRVNENNTSFYDTYKMGPVDESTTVLTPGTYNIRLIGGPFDANRTIALMSFAQFPVRTDDIVYPSESQPFGRLSFLAMSMTND